MRGSNCETREASLDGLKQAARGGLGCAGLGCSLQTLRCAYRCPQIHAAEVQSGT